MGRCVLYPWAVLVLVAAARIETPDAIAKPNEELNRITGEEDNARSGSWRVIATEVKGKTTKVVNEHTLTINKDKTWTYRVKGRVLAKGSVKRDGTKSSKQIDFQYEESDDPALKGVTLLGIYEIRGDQLTICSYYPGGGRPNTFSAGKESTDLTVVTHYKRAKR